MQSIICIFLRPFKKPDAFKHNLVPLMINTSLISQTLRSHFLILVLNNGCLHFYYFQMRFSHLLFVIYVYNFINTMNKFSKTSYSRHFNHESFLNSSHQANQRKLDNEEIDSSKNKYRFHEGENSKPLYSLIERKI